VGDNTERHDHARIARRRGQHRSVVHPKDQGIEVMGAHHLVDPMRAHERLHLGVIRVVPGLVAREVDGISGIEQILPVPEGAAARVCDIERA